MKMTENKSEIIVAIGLILLLVSSRLTSHFWNMTAVGGIALFAGAYFSKKWISFFVITSGLLLSDMVLGFHNQMLVVYFSYALIAVLGFSLSLQGPRLKTVLMALSGGPLFFLITNFSVWLTGNMYPHTFDGLMESYIMGLPFFRNQILADLFSSVILFELARSPILSLAIRPKL